MNVDHIFEIFNRCQVRYLLIGGMNFYLRHEPVTTLDVDLWIEDSPENRRRCESALSDLHASWGETESQWEDVANKAPGWLDRQNMFCLLSPAGALDVFRQVRGLDDWERSFENAIRETTPGGVPYRGLADEDMLRCQLALDDNQRKQDRVRFLQRVVTKTDE